MSEWKETTLGEVLTFQRGFDITHKQLKDGIYDVIFSSGFGGKHNEYKVKAPGVVIGRKGTLGTVFYTENDFWATDTTLWVKNFHGNYPKFAYYFLKILRLENYDCGSANPTLNRNHIHLLPVKFPNYEEQKQIADILSCLDNKIDNLRRQNETLEKIAQTLFKHWFINFEFPNDEGKPYKSSGGAMVASELGDIPAGWRVERLGDLTQTITKGTTPTTFKKDFVASGINFIKAESITENHTLEKSKFSYIDESTNLLLKRSIVKEKDILYTIAGTIGRYAMITSSSLPANTNQAVAIIRPNVKKIYPEYLLCYFASINYRHYLSSRIVQAVQANLSLGVLSDSPITIPEQRIKSIFSEFIVPIFSKIEFNQQQIQTLTKTRDTLLPKLMSGQIRVKEGESIIEEE